MRLRDPKSLDERDGVSDSAVYIDGDRVAVESDGTFEHESIDEQWAEGYAERNDATLAEVVINDSAVGATDGDEDGEICGTEMSDGSICERPVDDCPYHD